MATGSTAKLSPIKWFVGVLVFLIVTVGCASLGLWMSGGTDDGTPGAAAAVSASPGLAIFLIVFGVIIAALGMAAYGLILLTNCFTFNFTRPYFKGHGAKLWFGNLLIGLLLQTGFALVMAPTMLAVLAPIVPASFLWIAAFFLPFFFAQLLLIWLTIWAPLETGIIAKRLAAKGVGLDLLARGHYVGVSDPAKNSLKKMTLVEEDMGMLWIEPHALMYRGDAIDWDYPREQVLEIERKADAGSTSSYFGAVHVILRVLDPGGERRIRLHTEGDWTMTSKARALNDLAEKLASWKASGDTVVAPPSSTPAFTGGLGG
jgi:hypothetical protein